MSYYTTLADTLIFNAVDLQALDGVVIEDLGGIFAPGMRRGDHDTIAGRQGKRGAELPYDAYTFAVPITILGDTRSQMLTRLRALGDALYGTNGLGLLERRLDNGAGYDTHTANGQFASFNTFSLLNPSTGQTELNFVNLDGAWLSGSTWLVP